MTTTIVLQSVPWFDRLLWAAGHSLWQGALAAGLVWMCGRFIASARAKHALAWTALLCVSAMFAATLAIAPRTILLLGPPSESFEFGAMTGAMWLAALAALFALILIRLSAIARLLRTASPISAEANQTILSAAQTAGSLRRPNTIVSSRIQTPAAVHNRILLPVDCLKTLDVNELAAVIAHEDAHLRRRDFWLNVGQNILEAILLFNPFAWYISARIRVEREHCCDDAAVEATGDVVAYGRALAKLAVGRELQPALAIAMADAKVSHRIRRLSSPRRTQRGGAWIPAVAVAASGGAFALFALLSPGDARLPNLSPQEDKLIVRTIQIEKPPLRTDVVVFRQTSSSTQTHRSRSSTFGSTSTTSQESTVTVTTQIAPSP